MKKMYEWEIVKGVLRANSKKRIKVNVNYDRLCSEWVQGLMEMNRLNNTEEDLWRCQQK